MTIDTRHPKASHRKSPNEIPNTTVVMAIAALRYAIAILCIIPLFIFIISTDKVKHKGIIRDMLDRRIPVRFLILQVLSMAHLIPFQLLIIPDVIFLLVW